MGENAWDLSKYCNYLLDYDEDDDYGDDGGWSGDEGDE